MAFLTQPHELTEKKTFKGLICRQPSIGKNNTGLTPNPVYIDVDNGMYASRTPLFFDALLLSVGNYS